jgi:arylsulfatase A-like enzyme
MMKKTIVTFAAALAVAAVLTAAPTTPAADNPNIILFLVDDMGWMDCGAYGSQYFETPHMDAFAKQSMRFTRAYAHPGCSPTRASILTGQTAARHGITTAWGHMPDQPKPPVPPGSRTFLDLAQVTVAESLRNAGYRTGHFGKWHVGRNQEHWPEAQGFDVSWHCAPDAGPPSYFSPYGVNPPGTERPLQMRGKPLFTGTITDGPEGECINDRLTDESLTFIRENQDRPFLLHMWHYGVHSPYEAKDEDIRVFLDKKDPRGQQANPIMAAMLRSVDKSLGRLTAELDRLDLAEKTIVLFMSDNGGVDYAPKGERGLAEWRRWLLEESIPPTSNAPLREGKRTIYEGGIRVPFMVRWPDKVPAGSVCDAVVGCMDLYPTLLDLLDLPTPSQQKIDGISIAPVLHDPDAALPDRVYLVHYVKAVAAIRGDWKFVRHHKDGLRELYHLGNDIGETRNVIDQHPEKARELEAAIDAHFADADYGIRP